MPGRSILKLANISAFIAIIIFTLSDIVRENNAGVKSRRVDEFGVVQVKDHGENWQLTRVTQLPAATDSISQSGKLNRR